MVEEADEWQWGLAAFYDDELTTGFEYPEDFIQVALCQWIIIGKVAEGKGDADTIEVTVGEGKPRDISIDESDVFTLS